MAGHLAAPESQWHRSFVAIAKELPEMHGAAKDSDGSTPHNVALQVGLIPLC